MTEYTLVFRRAVDVPGRRSAARRAWAVARPAISAPLAFGPVAASTQPAIAQVFAVPICSALALDGADYERFLVESGALSLSVNLLGSLALRTPVAMDIARKEIQALVMAAEVQHIVGLRSA
jgi:hypothetical protein